MNKSCCTQSPSRRSSCASVSVSVTSCGGGSNKLSPSSGGDDQYLTPKIMRQSFISKPSPKRSRASKKSPTTLLNADAKNFRSLVQQYTGCRRRSGTSSGTSISFTNPTGRGPININFAHVTNDRFSISHNVDCCGQSQPIMQQRQQQHYQLQLEEQEQEQVSNEVEEEENHYFGFDFDSFTADDDFLPTISSCFPRLTAGSGSEIPHGLFMDDLYFFA